MKRKTIHYHHKPSGNKGRIANQKAANLESDNKNTIKKNIEILRLLATETRVSSFEFFKLFTTVSLAMHGGAIIAIFANPNPIYGGYPQFCCWNFICHVYDSFIFYF